jgi:hypothetical protein
VVLAREQGDRKQGAQRRRSLLQLLPGLLLLLLLLPSGCERLEPRHTESTALNQLERSSPTGQLQEVAPPGAVQQLTSALADYHPRISITRPAAETVLPAGSWSLELNVDDWPLVHSESLGLGPHVVVQVDDTPPQRISTWEQGDSSRGDLHLEMAELTPGSHRIHVYAARPWGEAVKPPGASAELVVHRVSPNPLSQPQRTSPQLLPVVPTNEVSAEPVLIDWLLQNAPLQGLRPNDTQWRLRISVNGDSFLVDQNTPLWLEGFHRGSNAVLFELLDGRGEPLNPPYNSAVREVVLNPAAPQPPWLKSQLNGHELAVLTGRSMETPPVAPPEERHGWPTPGLPEESAAGETLTDAPPENLQAGPEAGEVRADQTGALPEEAELAVENGKNEAEVSNLGTVEAEAVIGAGPLLEDSPLLEDNVVLEDKSSPDISPSQGTGTAQNKDVEEITPIGGPTPQSMERPSAPEQGREEPAMDLPPSMPGSESNP